jgi:nucleoside-diphosphate-sugar epimerase
MPDGSVLVTRTAGFIGFDVARRLWRDGATSSALTTRDPGLKEACWVELAICNREWQNYSKSSAFLMLFLV